MSEFIWYFPDLKSESLRNPDLDETQLLIQQWLVHEGDQVETNQPLITLTTEEQDIVLTVDSPVKGTLKSICLEQGSMVSTGADLAIFELED